MVLNPVLVWYFEFIVFLKQSGSSFIICLFLISMMLRYESLVLDVWIIDSGDLTDPT